MSDAAELTYPEKPDANGTAKKYFKRRAFYFGPHNTPDSFILFGEWKKRLIETGEPPEVKSIRRDLQHVIKEQEEIPETRSYVWPTVVVFSSFALAAAIVASTVIYSTRAVPKVDGKVLSDEETRYVRGLRFYKARVATLQEANPSEIAELYARIKEMGPHDGSLHKTGGDF